MARTATGLPAILLACMLCLPALEQARASAYGEAPPEDPSQKQTGAKSLWFTFREKGKPLPFEREKAFKVSETIGEMYRSLGEPDSESIEDNLVSLPEVKNKEVFLRFVDLCSESPKDESGISLKTFAALLEAANYLEIPAKASGFFFTHISEAALRGPSARDIFCKDMYERAEDPREPPEDAGSMHVFAAPRESSVYASLMHGFAKTLGLEARTRVTTTTAMQEQYVVKKMIVCSEGDSCEDYGQAGDSREGYQYLKITPEALDIAFEKLGPDMWRAWGWFFKHMNMCYLDMSKCKISPDDANCISEIGASRLNVSRCALSEAALAQLLAHDRTKKNLQALDISHNTALGPDSINALEALEALSELKILECNPSRDSLAQILDSEKIRSALHSLSFSDAEYPEEEEKSGLLQRFGLRKKHGILQKIASLENLRCLHVRLQNFRSGSLAQILSGKIKASLCTLSVSKNTNMNKADRRVMSNLALQSLDLEKCFLGAGSLAQILNGKIKASLRILNVRGNRSMNEADRQAMSNLALFDLNLEECLLTAGSLAQILNGLIKASLRILNASWNTSMNEADRRAMSGILLEHLNLERCLLPTGSLAQVLNGLINQSLRILNASWNRSLSEADRQAMSGILLEHLNLERCFLDAGSLAQILNGKIKASLRILNVRGNTNMNEADRQAMSNLALLDLNLEECLLTAGSLAQILNGLIKASLRILNVRGNRNMDPQDRQAISALALQSLNLEQCFLDAGSLAQILNGLIKASLRTLNVRGNRNLSFPRPSLRYFKQTYGLEALESLIYVNH
jgi:hypothetical protein